MKPRAFAIGVHSGIVNVNVVSLRRNNLFQLESSQEGSFWSKLFNRKEVKTMGIKMPYLEPGIEELRCDHCDDPNAIHGETTILCKDCAQKLAKLLDLYAIDFDFECCEIEY